MRKTFFLILIALGSFLQAQETANRFFYELVYRPQKDSARTDKAMMILDIVKDRSIYRDYLNVSQDSIIQATFEKMQKSGTFVDMSKMLKMPKFGHKVVKLYPSMEVKFAEKILQDNLIYREKPQFNWQIGTEKAKIGAYNVQKATGTYAGRTWNAWFTNDIPFQDGPYKFSGLPGLIVKIEDKDLNYSWELKGNKKVENFEELTYGEKLGAKMGQKVNDLEVSREKFNKTFEDYKKDPFANVRNQVPANMMQNKIPGSDKTIGEMLKDQEKMLKDFLNANNNSIEVPENSVAKKKK